MADERNRKKDHIFNKEYQHSSQKDKNFVKNLASPVERTPLNKNKTIMEKFDEYNKITAIDSIARRYLVLNGFDGALPILGIIISSFIAGVVDSRLIISVCLGAAVAMLVSGIWGAYMTEAAERKKELKELERSMLTRLKKTKISRAGDFAIWITAIVNGVTPFLVAIAIVTPFLVMPISIAYYASFVIAFSLLFFLGMFLGKISKENLILSGIKMLFAGVIILIVILMLGVAGYT